MNEIDPLEKQLQSWTPRRPAPRISGQLFGARSQADASWKMMLEPRFWSWATPIAACCLALVVSLNTRAHTSMAVGSDNASYFTTVSMDSPQNSNTSRQTYALNKHDVNLENNVWSTAVMATGGTAVPLSNGRGGLPVAVTNRYD